MSLQSSFDQDDIKALAEILEQEHRHHCHKRTICFWLFVFWFVMLVAAIGLAAYIVLRPESGPMDSTLAWVQALTALSAAVVSFFSMWWTVQNCIHSIERTLFAARAGRYQLFSSLLGDVQCADKEKRRVWLEVIKAAVA